MQIRVGLELAESQREWQQVNMVTSAAGLQRARLRQWLEESPPLRMGGLTGVMRCLAAAVQKKVTCARAVSNCRVAARCDCGRMNLRVEPESIALVRLCQCFALCMWSACYPTPCLWWESPVSLVRLCHPHGVRLPCILLIQLVDGRLWRLWSLHAWGIRNDPKETSCLVPLDHIVMGALRRTAPLYASAPSSTQAPACLCCVKCTDSLLVEKRLLSCGNLPHGLPSLSKLCEHTCLFDVLSAGSLRVVQLIVSCSGVARDACACPCCALSVSAVSGPWQFPHLGQRLGEALHPGPGEPGRRVRGKSHPPTLRDSSGVTQETVEDTPSQKSIVAGAQQEREPWGQTEALTTMSGRSDDADKRGASWSARADVLPRALDLEPPHGDVIRDGSRLDSQEGATPPPIQSHAVPPQILVHLRGEENPESLKCRWNPSSRSWRWQLGTRDLRIGPKRALHQWLLQCQERLTDESAHEVRAVADMLEEDETWSPPTKATLTPAPSARASPAHTLPSQPLSMPTTSLSLPSADECQRLLDTPTSDYLARDIRSQWNIPPSVADLVIDCLSALWEAGQSLEHTTAQQRLAKVMFVLASRWCWVEPQRPVQDGVCGRLPPHSRPKLIKERVLLCRAGRWHQLLCPADAGLEHEPVVEAPPVPPGLLTQHRVEALYKNARWDKLGKAWRQIWSYGAPTPTDRVREQLFAKLGVLNVDEEVPPLLPRPQVEDQQIVKPLTEETWLSSLATFRTGKAPDSLGWTQALWAAMAKHPSTAPAFRYLSQGPPTDTPDRDLTRILTLTRVVGLYKNAAGDVRPISVPTCWRKSVAAWTVAAWKETMMTAVPSYQHGCGTPDGVNRMADDLGDVILEHGDWVHLHLDVANAFSTISRAQVYQASPVLGASQYHWLARSSSALMPFSRSMREMTTFHDGIPQGDPLSAWAFCLTLDKCVNQFIGDCKQNGFEQNVDWKLVAYMDDVVLSADVKAAPKLLELWTKCLRRVGLHVNPAKMLAYHQRISTAELGDIFEIPEKQCSNSGLIVCGGPLPHLSDLDSVRGDFLAIPVGTEAFVQSFLERRRSFLQQQCACIEELSQLLPACGVHIGLTLLRRFVLHTQTHLLRSLHVPLTQEWAASIDAVVLACFVKVARCANLTPVQQQHLCAPIAFGGLGFQALRVESALHALSYLLACRDRHRHLPVSPALSKRFDAAWGFVSRFLDLERLFACPPNVLLSRGLQAYEATKECVLHFPMSICVLVPALQ